MKIKMILPSLTEAKSPFFRPIKYSLFPPLGLATLAGYLSDNDDVTIIDEHVEKLNLNDKPDLVVLQVYITSAYRAYEIADQYRQKGVYVVMGGIHVTSLPQEAQQHADSIFLGPGEDIWPQFLSDFLSNNAKPVYQSVKRSLIQTPPIRRDLIKSHNYLVPNSIVVSRGCPHHCDFCYKEPFFKGGKSFYTQPVDEALKEINRLPGRHLYFLDDHLFGNQRFAESLFDGMKGMGRLWQSAGTIQSVLKPGLLEKAVESGLRSLFIGFETLNKANLLSQNKHHNINRDYETAIKRLRDLGVMINGSFVFGLDEDDESVFDSTVEWAIKNGIETATFHILTPYPGTALYERMLSQGRIVHHNYDLYDTRHVVYQPTKLSAQLLEDGYWRAYKNFYSWSSIFQSAMTKENLSEKVRHLLYSSGWKKFEPMWSMLIKMNRVTKMLPLLEKILSGFQSPKVKVEEEVQPALFKTCQ